MAENRRSGKLAVILHADVAGSTDLVRQDEQLAHRRIQETFRRFSDTITKYHGSVRERRGDALLAEFERASDAVIAALAFQADQVACLVQLKDSILPKVRVGIAMGEVIIADGTITGEGVVLAQRIEQLAEAGDVVIQGAAYETIPGRFPFEYENLGEHNVKGFDEPVRVYGARLKGGADLPQPTQTVHRTHTTIIALTSVALVAAIVGLMWFKPWEIREEPASVERMAFPLPNKSSIAVLPFDNLSGDQEQDYFSDGITNDIITDLSKFKDLFVIASNSTFTYKGKPVKVQQVAEDLGVRYVLEGSVQATADRIRINAQLIDATSGRHLWAERYDRVAGDMFAIQNEIIETIVSTLAFKVETAERERAFRTDTESSDAYDYYLRATGLPTRSTNEANTKAGELYKKAIELDPKYAKAISGLAWIHVNDYQFGWSEDAQGSLTRALELAKKAVAIAPDDYNSRWVLGYIHLLRREFDLSEAAYEHAYALNPNDAGFLSNRATTLLYLGRPEEAIKGIKEAMRLNPHHPESLVADLGWAYYDAGLYEESVKTFRSMTTPPPWVHRTLAAAYVQLGRLDEARGEISQMLEKEPDYNLENTKVWPYKDPARLDRYIEDLRKAGVPEQPPLKLPDKPSIVVLPFVNLYDDGKQDYFVDGFTNAITTHLSKFPQLFVISSTTAFTYKGKSIRATDIGSALGVKYVLEGSVQRGADTLSVHAQLIDTETDHHVWAEQYDVPTEKVFSVQADVIAEIVGALHSALRGEAMAAVLKRPATNLQGYDLYLRALAGGPSKESRNESIRLLKQVIEMEPDFLEAHYAISTFYLSLWRFGMADDAEETLRLARRHADKAMEIDQRDYRGHYLLGLLYLFADHDHDLALANFERALGGNPNDADILYYMGFLQSLMGRAEEAIAWNEKAKRLNPRYPGWYNYNAAMSHFWVQDYEKAIVLAKSGIAANPKVLAPRRILIATLVEMDRLEEAKQEVTKYLEIRPNFRLSTFRNTPFKHQADQDRYFDALRKAGIPD